MISPASNFHATTPQLQNKSAIEAVQSLSKRVLLATTDLEIRHSIGDLLSGYKIKTLLATGLEEIKSALARNDIAACFCGFWLIDGTYRDVVRYLRLQRAEIPVIVVCARTCSQEFRDYLTALNIRACDFISYPYRESDMDRILESALALRHLPAPLAT
jgi:DNA-binding NtrC family response regulator